MTSTPPPPKKRSSSSLSNLFLLSSPSPGTASSSSSSRLRRRSTLPPLLDPTSASTSTPTPDQAAWVDYVQQETQSSEELLTATSRARAYLTSRPGDATLCLLHVCRLLVNARSATSEASASASVDAVLEDVLFAHHPPTDTTTSSTLGELGPAAWNRVFAAYPLSVWIKLLRVLCVLVEVLPAKHRQQLLSSSADVAAAMKHTVESLPYAKYEALRLLVGVLGRSSSTGTSSSSSTCTAGVFGAWLLLSSRPEDERRSQPALERAAQVMGQLVSMRELVFEDAAETHYSTGSRVSSPSSSPWHSMVKNGLSRPFRTLRPQANAKRNSLLLTNEDEEQARARMLQDVRNKPPRHRESIERIYGVMPRPPSPRRRAAPAAAAAASRLPPPPPFVAMSKLSSTSSTDSNTEESKSSSEKDNKPAAAAAAPPPRSTAASPPPRPATKPVFVLKPASSSASLGGGAGGGGVRPHQLYRQPPPRPSQLLQQQQQQQQPPRSSSPSIAAAALAGAARRRAASREAA